MGLKKLQQEMVKKRIFKELYKVKAMRFEDYNWSERRQIFDIESEKIINEMVKLESVEEHKKIMKILRKISINL